VYQKITIIGFLGSDPEKRYLSEGTAVTNFSVATNRKWDGGEETVWFRVSTWNRLAENCYEYLEKGRKVFVEGRLKPGDDGNPRTWQDSQGRTRANFEITAHTVLFLGGGNNQTKAEEAEEENEIPF